MIREIWINLPVKDVKRTKAFFQAIGFQFNTKYADNDQSASLMLGSKGIILMLFEESVFRGFVSHEVADTSKGSEVLISFDAESREEVDELAEKVRQAGGRLYSEPMDMQGWMYGLAFIDPDGHRWNMVYMDFSKMPGQ